MTKAKLINIIDNIIDFLTNGSVIRDNIIYNGHPNFYLKHSKEEFEKELEAIVKDKESYDRYDLYYYTNYMFKYMLNEYDSHTKMFFMDHKLLPIKIRFINNIPYIVDINEKYSQYKGARILSVNDIDVDIINKELEKIICYASENYLKIMLEDYLTNANIIKSLPLLSSSAPIIITTDMGKVQFDLDNIDEYVDKSIKPNYKLDINGSTALITYNSCSDEQKMIALIEELNKNNTIEKYIVDLRGNNGGNSSINKHLVEYLKGKNIIVLCDERVFSSARMCAIDLKKIGARLVGTNPGTSINCFGNNLMNKKFKDVNLRVCGSVTYWYYDENLRCRGFYKEDFEEELKRNPKLLEPVFLNVDDIVELTLDDFMNNYDSVLEYALSLCSKKIRNT